MAVTGALLTFVFWSFVLLGTVWTFEMQTLLNDTNTVQTILNTLLNGMILLVSTVVPINSIVLSHDMSFVDTQENQIQGAAEFHGNLGELSEPGENPSERASFLKVMARVIRERAQALEDDVDGLEQDVAEDIKERTSSVVDPATQLGSVRGTTGAEFAVLWKGMEFQYGPQLERSRRLQTTHGTGSETRLEEQLDDIIEA